MRHELGMDETRRPPIIGDAEAVAQDEDHMPHSYLYLPDLSSETRWSAHRVPERTDKVERRREMGFRR